MHKRTAIALAALVGCFAVGCVGDDTVVPMPDALMGRWTTTAADYRDRYFEIDGQRLVLGTGGSTSRRYTVRRVLRTEDDQGVLYTIEYRDAVGEEYDMSFYFDANSGTLRFENQPRMRWTRSRVR